jgi:acyl-CoA synthetase (AMP-forming)/AMP-acid ligase II
VAVAFIDRQISEGRGAKVATRTADSVITYAELADNVNRCAGGLLHLGLARGDRMLMVVKDCPAFFYLFWGAIKAGIVPVPLNTLLRSSSYAFMIDDSSAAALVYSPEFAGEVEPAIAAAALRFAYRGQRAFACLAAHAKSAAIRCRAGNSRR